MWFWDDFCDESFLGFQNRYSNTWYLEEALSSIPLSIGRCFRGFCNASFGVLFCGVVLDADIHLKLRNPVVSGAWFLTAVVFECNIAHRRFVAVLCMMYTIRCNPRYSLYGALPLPCVQARLIRGALVAHRHTYICASSLQNLTVSHDFYFPLSVSVERSCWLCIRCCWTGGF